MHGDDRGGLSMKSNRTLACVATIALALLPTAATWAADPSMNEVYSVAASGRVGEAEQMMQQVLRDHPNSAKAHYVDAELLAKAGRTAEARSQLATAQSLAPGLPFAKPEAVVQLERQLQQRSAPASTFAPAQRGGFPWGFVLLIGVVVLLVITVIRAFARRNAMMNAPMSGPEPQPMYGGYGPNGMPPSGGMGSGIMGGLATGAALGAGMVAGEALAHHFTDDDERHRVIPQQDVDANDNMGGNDFGVSDGGSWDDSGGGGDMGGGDWS
jgi:hypothetical protein